MSDHIKIAVTKGDRIVRQQLALLAQVDIEPIDDLLTSRKLVLTTNNPNVELLLLRGSDVATYVEHGIADLGMAGRDVLLEHGEQGYYQPLDLKLGQCRIMVAGLKDEPAMPGRLRIATKFVKTAKRYYSERGIQVDIIQLYGAMELAPVTGLAHRIVDIVETGNTLKANGLVAMEHIADVSTRLIVNKTAMKMKYSTIHQLIEQLRGVVD